MKFVLIVRFIFLIVREHSMIPQSCEISYQGPKCANAVTEGLIESFDSKILKPTSWSSSIVLRRSFRIFPYCSGMGMVKTQEAPASLMRLFPSSSKVTTLSLIPAGSKISLWSSRPLHKELKKLFTLETETHGKMSLFFFVYSWA